MGRQDNVEIFEDTQRLYSSNERLISAIKNSNTGCVLKPLSLLCTVGRSMIRIIECFSRFLAACELLHMVGAET